MKLRNKKTGEIGELHYYPDKEYHFAVSTKDPTQMGIYKTLGELLQDWTDFIVHEPTEPLIEDDKVRKAVRAWAEANGVSMVYIVDLGLLRDESTGNEIKFNGEPFIGLLTSLRTIEELCGEEDA